MAATKTKLNLVALTVGLLLIGADFAAANDVMDEAADRAKWQEDQRQAREAHEQQEEENRQRHADMIRQQEEDRRRQQQGMRQAASQQGMESLINAGMNFGMAAILRRPCKKGSKGSCIMAAMSAANGMLSLSNSNRTKSAIIPKLNADPYATTAFQESEFPGMDLGGGPGGGGPGDPGGPGRGFDPQQAKKLLSELKGMGYNPDMENEILHTPNGSVPFSAFSDAAGAMEQLGLSPEEIQEAMGAVEQAGADIGANVVAMDLDGGAGGGARFDRGVSSSDDSDPLGDYLRSLRGPASQTKAEMVAGKSRLLGGDPIGVAADNIFDMVHRRYQEKRKQGLFIESPDAKPKELPSQPRF